MSPTRNINVCMSACVCVGKQASPERTIVKLGETVPVISEVAAGFYLRITLFCFLHSMG